MIRWAMLIVWAAAGLACSSGAGWAHHRVLHPHAAHAGKLHRKLAIARAHSAAVDLSGRKQAGCASFYAPKFNGRKMANGGRFTPGSDSAASKTLPLGTVAKVTNLRTGTSVRVVVRDRGPHVNGRVVDLSPRSARNLGIDRRHGIAPVVVAPIAVPHPDGSVHAGAGAAAITPVETTETSGPR